jgi:arylsulfatase A-like enzyme
MPDRPNVVRIVAHDAGQHVGCYGVDTVHTPHLDRLAAEGVRFENSFCVAPQCSPSRASMVTGRYPHSNGVMGLAHDRFAWELHDDEHHLAALLSDAGWHSALAGTHHATRDDDAFDEVLADEGAAERVADAAAGAIRERTGDGDAPLHLQVGFFEPHRRPRNPGAFPTPSDPDDYDADATLPAYLVDEPSARDELRAFEAAVERMDAAVGRVLDALDEVDAADETVVVATTDHGVPFPRAKCSPYDPGLETFLLARWPDRLPAGAVRTAPIATVDHLPTLFDLLGLDAPASVQGVSHADVATGAADATPRGTVFAELTHHDYTDPRRAIRADGYKCVVNFTNAPFFMDPSQDHRPGTITRDPSAPRLAYHPPVELYDLEADPLETENLAADPDHEAARTDLLGRLHEWMRETDDPLLEGIPTPPLYDAAIESLETGSVVDPADR